MMNDVEGTEGMRIEQEEVEGLDGDDEVLLEDLPILSTLLVGEVRVVGEVPETVERVEEEVGIDEVPETVEQEVEEEDPPLLPFQRICS